MSAINIVRTDKALPDMTAAGEFLFGAIDGFSRDDRRAWRSFWGRVKGMDPGEMALIEARMPRNSKFHRKFFALLNVGFDAWDPGRKRKTHKGIPVTKNFEQFREDVTILAGYYEQTYDLRGRMKLKAKSISFANMEEPEFEKLYSAVADVLLERVLARYANRAELDVVVQQVMGFV